METFAVVIIAILAQVAIMLVYMGRRRRVGNKPHCKKCDYLLHGISSDKCPECGTPLSTKTVVYGEWRRRRKAFFCGLLTLFVLSVLLGLRITPRNGVNWYYYVPTWFISGELNRANQAEQQSAWMEMKRRETASRLDASGRDAMVRYALKRQANAGPTFNFLDVDATNYLGARFLARDLPADQVKTFFDQSLRTHLEVRETVVFPDLFTYRVAQNGLGPSTGNFWTKITSRNVLLDGQPIEGQSGSTAMFKSTGFYGGSYGITQKCPPPGDGKHILSVTAHIEIYSGNMSYPDASTLEFQTDRTMTASFAVLTTRPADLIRPVADPKLAASMAAALKPMVFCQVKYKNLRAVMGITDLPVGLACDVIAVYGGKEHPLGAITYRARAGVSGSAASAIVDTAPPATIDLILRPNEKAALNSVDIYSYWNQDIVFLNVPVVKQ